MPRLNVPSPASLRCSRPRTRAAASSEVLPIATNAPRCATSPATDPTGNSTLRSKTRFFSIAPSREHDKKEVSCVVADERAVFTVRQHFCAAPPVNSLQHQAGGPLASTEMTLPDLPADPEMPFLNIHEVRVLRRGFRLVMSDPGIEAEFNVQLVSKQKSGFFYGNAALVAAAMISLSINRTFELDILIKHFSLKVVRIVVPTLALTYDIVANTTRFAVRRRWRWTHQTRESVWIFVTITYLLCTISGPQPLSTRAGSFGSSRFADSPHESTHSATHEDSTHRLLMANAPNGSAYLTGVMDAFRTLFCLFFSSVVELSMPGTLLSAGCTILSLALVNYRTATALYDACSASPLDAQHSTPWNGHEESLNHSVAYLVVTCLTTLSVVLQWASLMIRDEWRRRQTFAQRKNFERADAKNRESTVGCAASPSRSPGWVASLSSLLSLLLSPLYSLARSLSHRSISLAR